LSEEQAVLRYQECVYHHLVGRYEEAAEGLFVLVTTGALSDDNLHMDAEWYFAESLFALKNFRTAEKRFMAIAETEGHAFREDAVLRVLEILVETGEEKRFYEVYNREIVRGRVRATDEIRYSVARSFFRQDDLLQAKDNLLDIEAGSIWYAKAQYVLGAIMVQEEQYEEALRYFRLITEEISVDPNSVDSRQLYDLSLLAAGRVNMHLLRYAEASQYYGRVGGDSEYLEEKLYEHVWTFIKQKEEVRDQRLELGDSDEDVVRDTELSRREGEFLSEALRGIDIFLLAFPENEYTARLRLVQGSLYIQSGVHNKRVADYDRALEAYGAVVEDYEPIRKRFAELADSKASPSEYFELVLALEQSSASDEELPPFAMAMVMADQDLGRSLTIYRDLQEQADKIAKSEVIIAELDEVLGSSSGIGGFDKLEYQTRLNQVLAVQQQLQLLEIEAEWLSANGVDRRSVQRLRAERQRLASEALAERGSEFDPSVREDLGKLRQEFRESRALATPDSLVFARLDGNHTSIERSLDLLERSQGSLGSVVNEELLRIKNRFIREKGEVADQRRDLEVTLAEAERVSVGLTRSGFGRLEDFFARSVLRADVGIVDVFWAQKLDVSNELQRIRRERKRLRDDLLRRFRLIEQKMSE
jgi:tetratricopeptide (TPR) repeat protein